mmetsp:Transcript_15834/g.32203  ORF Transcript_15834/g.32203 Transcript_15834/m.32203 type:complete len:262 (+) Transcript_15834:595-1380(+)
MRRASTLTKSRTPDVLDRMRPMTSVARRVSLRSFFFKIVVADLMLDAFLICDSPWIGVRGVGGLRLFLPLFPRGFRLLLALSAFFLPFLADRCFFADEDSGVWGCLGVLGSTSMSIAALFSCSITNGVGRIGSEPASSSSPTSSSSSSGASLMTAFLRCCSIASLALFTSAATDEPAADDLGDSRSPRSGSSKGSSRSASSKGSPKSDASVEASPGVVSFAEASSAMAFTGFLGSPEDDSILCSNAEVSPSSRSSRSTSSR